jgi:hypothetical protein
MFKSVADVIAAIEAIIAHHYQRPRSFTWTAKFEDILANVEQPQTMLHNMATV